MTDFFLNKILSLIIIRTFFMLFLMPVTKCSP